jgi:hypothetical protein
MSLAFQLLVARVHALFEGLPGSRIERRGSACRATASTCFMSAGRRPASLGTPALPAASGSCAWGRTGRTPASATASVRTTALMGSLATPHPLRHALRLALTTAEDGRTLARPSDTQFFGHLMCSVVG